MKIMPLSLIAVLVVGLFSFIAFYSPAVQPVNATGGSVITFVGSPTITLSNDADANGKANIGDTITLSATASNDDGAEAGRACGMTLADGGTKYGQVGVTSIPLTTDNSGVSDVYTGTFVIADAGASGIDLGAGTDTVTIGCYDGDDLVPVTSATSALVQAVDTIRPTVNGANMGLYTGTCSGVGGVCIVGDTVTANWNNTAGGDNNADVSEGVGTSAVGIGFSSFGGGGVAASEDDGTPECPGAPTNPGADPGWWCASYVLAAGATEGNVTFTVTAVDNDKNQSASVASSSSYAIDLHKPTVTSATTNDSDNDGQIDQLTVVYDQAVTDADYNAVAVTGYTVPGTGSGSGTTTLVYNLTELIATPDTGAMPVLTFTPANGTDVNGNILDLTGAPATAADGAKPALLSITSVTGNGTYGPGQTINITANYSEIVTGGSIQVDLNSGKNNLNLTFTHGDSTITTGYVVGITGSGENTGALTVTNIDSNSATDGTNTATSLVIPATNIATGKTIAIDTDASVVVITAPAAAAKVKADTVFTFTNSIPGGTVECSIDAGAYAVCASGSAFSTLADWGTTGEGAFTLNVRDTDAVGNVGSDSETYTKDTVAPGFLAVTSLTWDTTHDGTIDTIRVDFNEQVNVTDAGGAGDGLSGISISNGCTAIANGDYTNLGATTILLNVTGCTVGNTAIVPTVTYNTAGNSIYDLAGNELPDSSNVLLTDDAAPVPLSAQYVDGDWDGIVERIMITFSQDTISCAYEASDWTINNAGTVNVAKANCSGGGNIVTFNVTSTAGITGGAVAPTFSYANQGVLDQLKDAANNPVADFGPFTVADGAAPYIFTANYGDDDADGAVDAVYLNTSADTGITCTAFNDETDFTVVTPGTVNLVTSAGDACSSNGTSGFKISLATPGNADMTGGAVNPVVTYTQPGNGVEDGAGNDAVGIIGVTATDGAGPVILSRTYFSSGNNGTVDRLYLTFSENAVWNGNDMDQFDIVNNSLVNYDSNGIPDAFMGGSGTINLGLSTSGTTDLTGTSGMPEPSVQYTQSVTAGNRVKDAAGNDMASEAGPVSLEDDANPVKVGVIYYADADTNGQIEMISYSYSENVSYTYQDSDWTATANSLTGFDVTGCASCTNVSLLALDATANANMTGVGLGTEPQLAYTAGNLITDVTGNSAADFAANTLVDSAAPVLVGALPVYAEKQDQNPTSLPTNLWYYYAGDSLAFRVEASEPITTAKACVKSIKLNDKNDVCDPAEFGVAANYITHSFNPAGNTYEFYTDIVAGIGGVPAGVGGFPVNVALVDGNGNEGYSTADPSQTLIAVFNIIPTTLDATLGGTTTDWSTIADYTAATGIIFEKTGGGILSFAGPLDLTDSATVTALQSLSTNVITGIDNPTGTPVLGINSAALAAFDTAATLTAHMPTAVRPGLVVYDNTGTQIGTVPNDQSSNVTIGGDTLGTFNWIGGAQTLSWTTTGFSSFGTDSTPPTITAGNISLTSVGSGTGLAYKIGDQVIVEWDNSAAGDNNGADFDHATADFTGFGDAVSEPMTDTTACGGTAGDDIYEACYTIVAGSIDGTLINAAVTAYDLVGNYAAAAGTDNVTVDNIAPTIGTPGSLTIFTDTNSNSIANVGDGVNYTNGVAGAADADTWKVNLTTLTGEAAADAAGNPHAVILGTLTGAQTFTETITDNAGNTATGSTTALAVDNRSLLTATSVTPANTDVGAITAYTFAFTTNSIWPADGKIKITFPAGFSVSSLNTHVADNLSNVDGVLTVTGVAGQVVTVTRDGSGAAVPASTAVSFRLANGTNRATAGASGTFTYQTTNAADAEIDVTNAVPGFTLTATTTTTTTTTTTGGSGGSGGGGGTGATSSSNTSTSSVPATIDTITGNQTYGSPLQLQDENITVNADNNTATAPLTENGTLTLKPNSGSTIEAIFPPHTDVTGPADWNGRIDPPIVKSLTLVSTTGDDIAGTNDTLKRDDVAAIVKVGANVPLQFSNEVTLNIPVDLPNGSVVLLYTSLDGVTWTPAGEGVVQDGVLVVKTDHFTYFAVAMTGTTKELAAQAAEEAKTGFADIVGHWAAAYINQLADLGIVSGKSATSFAPDANITRAELTKIATKAFNIAVNPEPASSPFGDVSTSEWYAPYIIAARDAGIVKGYEGDVFSPNGLVNRAEALKIILGAAGLDEVAAEKIFEDVSTQDWFAGFVTYAVHNSIVSGRTSTTFAPADSITRAEVAKIVVKVMEMK